MILILRLMIVKVIIEFDHDFNYFHHSLINDYWSLDKINNPDFVLIVNYQSDYVWRSNSVLVDTCIEKLIITSKAIKFPLKCVSSIVPIRSIRCLTLQASRTYSDRTRRRAVAPILQSQFLSLAVFAEFSVRVPACTKNSIVKSYIRNLRERKWTTRIVCWNWRAFEEEKGARERRLRGQLQLQIFHGSPDVAVS